MPKNIESRSAVRAVPAPLNIWGLIALNLKFGVEPPPADVALALRGPDEIPRIVREYLACLFERKRRGRRPHTELEQLARDYTICTTYLTARRQIEEEDAAAKQRSQTSRRGKPAPTKRAARVLERTSELLAKEKIILDSSAIKNIVHDKRRGLQSWADGTNY